MPEDTQTTQTPESVESPVTPREKYFAALAEMVKSENPKIVELLKKGSEIRNKFREVTEPTDPARNDFAVIIPTPTGELMISERGYGDKYDGTISRYRICIAEAKRDENGNFKVAGETVFILPFGAAPQDEAQLQSDGGIVAYYRPNPKFPHRMDIDRPDAAGITNGGSDISGSGVKILGNDRTMGRVITANSNYPEERYDPLVKAEEVLGIVGETTSYRIFSLSTRTSNTVEKPFMPKEVTNPSPATAPAAPTA